MALKKKKRTDTEKETTEPKGLLKTKVGKPNISQAGLIRALKKRGYMQISDAVPPSFIKDNTTILVHTDKATVADSEISVPLGKGAINKLMKSIAAK